MKHKCSYGALHYLLNLPLYPLALNLSKGRDTVVRQACPCILPVGDYTHTRVPSETG